MSLTDAFWSAPPISRTMTAASVVLSFPGHLGFYNLLMVVFFKDYIFTFRQLPELWRLVTCFFITGPKLSMIFDPYFLFHYSSQLEIGSPRFSGPGTYFFFLIFCSLLIMLTGGLYLEGMSLMSPLSMAIMYIFAQEDPNRQIMFFIVQTPSKYLPYATLGITLILAGPYATMLQATGLFAAHVYDFLDRIWPQHGGGTHLISTPVFIQRLFARPSGEGIRRAAGTAYAGTPAQATQQRQAGGRGGFTSGFSSGSFGSGRRLGGD